MADYFFTLLLHTAPWTCGGKRGCPDTTGSQTDSRLNEILAVSLSSVAQSKPHAPLSGWSTGCQSKLVTSATTHSEFTKSWVDWVTLHHGAHWRSDHVLCDRDLRVMCSPRCLYNDADFDGLDWKRECNTTETAFRITLKSPSESSFCTITYITRQSQAVRVAPDSVIVQKQHVIHQIVFHTKQNLYLNPFGQFIQFQACHFVQAGH